MNKSQRYGSCVIVDKYLLVKEPDYAKFMEERLWGNFKDLILKELKENDSIIVEKAFDMQKDLFETNQIQVRQDISVIKLIHCKDCKYLNKEEMRCFEVEGLGYRNVSDDDFCSRGERKDGEEE